MKSYKEGQKVKVVACKDCQVPHGLGVLQYTYPYYYCVTLDKRECSGETHCHALEIEPVEEREFKAGQTVREIAFPAYIRTIDRVEGDRAYYVGGGFDYFRDIELIESPKKKEVKEEKAEEKELISQIFDYMWDCKPEYHKINLEDWSGGINVRWDSPKPKKHMTLSNIAKKILDPDLRALVEVGYLDSELELTEEGEEAVLELMFFANKEELAKQAKKELKERKKDK